MTEQIPQFLCHHGIKAFDADEVEGLSGWFDQANHKVFPKDLSTESLQGLGWNWDGDRSRPAAAEVTGKKEDEMEEIVRLWCQISPCAMQWTILKGEGSEALHRDRLRDAQGAGFRYLVLVAEAVAKAVASAEAGEEIIGFGCLVFRRPASWSDAGDTQHLPQIVDLRVKETRRGQGYGSDFVRAMERIAAAAGYRQLYLSVEPSTNPGAFAFYRRLGYQALQSEPYQKVWELIDSSGKVHRGEDWVVDMVKVIG